MSKQRYINTKFWDDNYVSNLDPIEKLLFLYFLTNPLTNISGIYEIPLKRISFDTGIDKEMVLKILERFENECKIKYSNGWLAIKNFINHQSLNPNVIKGIEVEFKKAPENLQKWVNIGFESLSHLNINYNINSNKKKKEKPKIVYPKIKEIYDYLKNKRFSDNTCNEFSKKIHEYYSENDWKDSSGKKVKSWKQKIIAVWMDSIKKYDKKIEKEIDYPEL